MNSTGSFRNTSLAATSTTALALFTRYLSLNTGQVTSAIGKAIPTVHHKPKIAAGIKMQESDSPFLLRVAGRIRKFISWSGSALALGTAVLLVGSPATEAGTLTFTFTDDGTTITITASGSLDIENIPSRAGLEPNIGSSLVGIGFDLPEGQGIASAIFPSRHMSYSRYLPISATVSGLNTFTGDDVVNNVPSFEGGFYVWVEAGALELDNEHINDAGTTYDPTGEEVTLTGTLTTVFEDNDFHVEHAFGNQKIVFRTPPLAKPTGLTATPGDGQITLDWTNPINSSISKYQYQLKAGSGEYGNWEDIDSDAFTTSFTVEGLTNGTAYTFKIRSAKEAEFSEESDEVTAAPGTPEAALLSATRSEDTPQVALSWTLAENPTITKWQYQQREGEEAFGDEWEDIPGSGAKTRSHSVTIPNEDATYGFRVRAVNVVGNGAASKEATVEPLAEDPPELSLENERKVLRTALASIGQATIAGTSDAIDERLKSQPATSALSLGGHEVASEASLKDSFVDTETGDWWTSNRSLNKYQRTIGDAEMLDGSAFTLSLSGEDADDSNNGWTIWSRSEFRSFEGKTGQNGWDGSIRSTWLGFDTWADERLLAGLAVSRNRGKTDLVSDQVTSLVETSLTAAWPYFQMTMPNGTGTVRAVLGVGSGEAKHHAAEGKTERAGLSMKAASIAARWAVSRQGKVTLSVPIEAEVVQLKTQGDSATVIGGHSVKSWRASSGVEFAHAGVPLSDSGWTLLPRGSMLFRWDGGNGVTGKGIEVSGGFGLHAPHSRLSLDASGHWLATHSDSSQREWGASIGVLLAPDSRGRGWSASLRQEWGLQEEDALSSYTLFQHDAAGSAPAHGSLAARAGYGFGMMKGLLTVSADARLATGEEEVPHYGAGVEFALPGGLSASLRGEHIDDTDPDARIEAGVHFRF